MGENDDHMEQMELNGDNGIGNSMVGMYIKHADKAYCEYFQFSWSRLIKAAVANKLWGHKLRKTCTGGGIHEEACSGKSRW